MQAFARDISECSGKPKGDPFSARYEELTAFDQRRNVEEYGCCITANWLCRRDLMRSIGGFNQELLSGGDVECSRRIVAAGHKLVYVPEMIVGHPTRGNLLELICKRRRVVGGRWHFHGSKSKADLLLGEKASARVKLTMRVGSPRPISKFGQSQV